MQAANDSTVKDIQLEEAVLINKNQKLAEFVHVVQKRRVDRAVVTTGDVPSGVLTIKDVLAKLGSRRMRNISPASLAISGLSSERIIVTNPDESILAAAQRLDEEDISTLPVMKDYCEVIGLLTKMNLIIFLRKKYTDMIEDFTLSHVGVIGSSATLGQAMERIRSSPTRELVVVENSKPIAILGEKEIAMALFNLLASDSVHHVGTTLDQLLVSDVMRRIKTVLPSKSDLNTAIDMLRLEKVNTLPVMEGERLVGLITRDDVFQYLLKKEKSTQPRR